MTEQKQMGLGSLLDEKVWICQIQYGILAQASDPPAGEANPPEPASEPAAEPDPPEPAAATDSAEDEADPEPAAEPAPAPTQDWRDRRIAQLTARLREEQRRGQATPPADPAAPPASPTEAEIERLVDERAAEQAAIRDFNRQCNEAAAIGREAFPDFDVRVGALKGLVSDGDPTDLMRYNQLLLAAIETGEAPTLLHRLGGNLNEAQRILEMSPIKMGIELARMAARPTGEPSGAPRPIRPLSPGSGSHDRIDPADADRSDRLSTAEWMRRREAQVAAVETARRRA